MTAFDKWAELDPTKLQRDIETSGCSDVTMTRYVDVEDMVRRVNAKHPGTVDIWGNLDPHRLLRDLQTGCASGSGYIQKWVHFGPGSYLIGGAGLGTTQVASFSQWVNVADLANFAFFIHQTGNGVDLSTGFNFAEFDIVLNAEGGNISQGSPDNTIPLNERIHLCGNMDISPAQGSRLMSLYLNGVSVLNHGLDADSEAGTASIDRTSDFIVPGYSSTDAADVLAQGEGVPFDAADYLIWLGTYIDFSNPANMAKFRDGGGNPVDPVAAVTAFGTPQLMLSGDKSSFPVNQGDGSPVTLKTYLLANGSNGAGSVTLTGAVAGKAILLVTDDITGGGTDYTSSFESSISIDDQIQQISGSDLSAISLVFQVEGTLMDAA